MRYIRTRRRIRFILAAIILVSAVLFAETRLDAFIPDIKSFTASKIEGLFGGTLRLSIGNLSGGIFHPISLNDCSITGKEEWPIVSRIVVQTAVSNYRVWDILSHRKVRYLSRFLPKPKEPRLDITFSSRNKRLSGFARVEGSPADSRIKGRATFMGIKTDFTGSIRGGHFALEFRTDRGTVSAEGDTSSGGVSLDIKTSHLKLAGYDIVCDMTVKNKAVAAASDGKGSALEGCVETKSLILNYKPFSNIRASYKVSGSAAEISEAQIGQDFRLCGTLGTTRPYAVELALTANNVNLAKLLSDLFSGYTSDAISGVMNGRFELKGPVEDLKSSARFTIKDGKLSGLDFINLTAVLKGDGPLIRIEDSQIIRSGGVFVLAGDMDLAKIKNGNVFEGVRMVSDDSALIWDSFDTVRTPDAVEARMKKSLNEQVDLNYKKVFTDYVIDENLGDRDEYELKYNLNATENLKLKVGHDKDFMGLEHKNKF